MVVNNIAIMRWRAMHDLGKLEHFVAFAHVLPRIRGRVNAGLRRADLPLRKVVAAVVKLLDATRIGNENTNATIVRFHYVPQPPGAIARKRSGNS